MIDLTPIYEALQRAKGARTKSDGTSALQEEKPVSAFPAGSIRRLEMERRDRERVIEQARKVYATQQENIKLTESLRGDITKGIQTGESPLSLLLKALECISLTTGDTLIYSEGKENLRAVYGWGLSDPAPLEQELREAQTRLAMLTRPELSQTTPDEQRRIQRAVTAHRELIERLETAIQGSITNT